MQRNLMLHVSPIYKEIQVASQRGAKVVVLPEMLTRGKVTVSRVASIDTLLCSDALK